LPSGRFRYQARERGHAALARAIIGAALLELLAAIAWPWMVESDRSRANQ